ncbi:hypothetical protein A2635_00725 [Candidatus Peribacteria bacterium RIFCSPHIGHO2_01_FULL_51_9]|nr:MAG: hypothetical protein A2635_00725 [Candidatus Peribacteria bacterium RIFCSPHIGHO2_01_FULL_51_9]
MLLFCATDAGGSREVIPIIKEALLRGIPYCVLSSAVTTPIFAGSDIPARECVFVSVQEAEHFLRSENISALILGTTGIIKNERYLNVAAKKLGLLSIAVLDEWYNYRLRFEDEEGEIGKYLPEVICVQDALSRELAVKEGLPEKCIRITGSPALGALSKRAHAFVKHPPNVPQSFQACSDRPVILFLSESLRSAYGAAQGECGTHGAFLGYTEESVRQDLADSLAEIGKESLVIEKLHPSEHTKEAPRVAKTIEWRTCVPSEALLPLLWYADIIVGMHTKALLEAALLGRKPISYQPQARHPESCTAVRLGVAELCSSKDALLQCLKERIKGGKEKRGPISHFPFANHDAAERVLVCVEKLMRDQQV